MIVNCCLGFAVVIITMSLWPSTIAEHTGVTANPLNCSYQVRTRGHLNCCYKSCYDFEDNLEHFDISCNLDMIDEDCRYHDEATSLTASLDNYKELSNRVLIQLDNSKALLNLMTRFNQLVNPVIWYIKLIAGWGIVRAANFMFHLYF